MNKEIYKRVDLEIIKFLTDDVITTSEIPKDDEETELVH